ncbi:hypothetical protein BDV40DRAFT_262801 [Aspergillus tamarii]|uniref:Uncharacterized protein n=1 Tax=Aspergillus tamarii TaxID=41984 RepID=A0A5N6UXN2_ASPTM|nr:hypothetical protein BDV40DRAFT_262801 [Aspergillus tamarii]
MSILPIVLFCTYLGVRLTYSVTEATRNKHTQHIANALQFVVTYADISQITLKIPLIFQMLMSITISSTAGDLQAAHFIGQASQNLGKLLLVSMEADLTLHSLVNLFHETSKASSGSIQFPKLRVLTITA